MIDLDALEREAKDCLAQGIHTWGQKIDDTLALIARIRELEASCSAVAADLYAFSGLEDISRNLEELVAKPRLPVEFVCDHTDAYGSMNLDGICMGCGVKLLS